MMVYAYNAALKSLRHFRAVTGDQYLEVVWDETPRKPFVIQQRLKWAKNLYVYICNISTQKAEAGKWP